MKITTFIIFAAILQVSAAGFAQKVTLSSNNARLTEVFNEIRNQTGYDFLFTSETLKDAKRVSIKVENAELKDVLNQLFTNQPLEYIINKKAVIVSKKEAPSFLDRVVDAFTPPIDISGLVLDEKGLPLAGVTVRLKGTNKAIFTDNAGRFYLAGVDDDAVIEFRMVGYKVLELSAKGKFEGLRMEIAEKELEEVVVAYGKTTQQALTGAVTVVKGEQIASLPNRSFDKSLQGLVPGLMITNGTGQPGGGVSNMVLRGISTGSDVSTGSTVRNPLIIIDGVPVSQNAVQFQNASGVTSLTNPLAQLNPDDIDNISILKDAAAIALYGSQASNGVILVTTKSGKAGKTIFNFSHSTNIVAKPTASLDILNKEQYLDLVYDTYRNSSRLVGGVPSVWTDADILADLKTKFPLRSDGSFYPASDWYGEMFRNNAISTANNMSVSGGNERNKFYMNLEYSKQNGAVVKTGYDRKSLRFNFNAKPTNWLAMGTNTALSYNIQDYANNSEYVGGFAAADIASPLIPIKLENGTYLITFPFGMHSSFVQNPVAVAEYNTSRTTSYRGMSSLFANAQLSKSVTFKSMLGIDFMLAELKQKLDPRVSTTSLPSISQRDIKTTSLTNTNILSFNKTFGLNHSIQVLLGQEARINTKTELGAEARGTVQTLPYYEQLNSPGYTMNNITGAFNKQTLASFFSEGRYTYLNKYFLSGSVRTDASSSFGEQQRWGTYWSAGAGWVLSEEKFIKEKISWLSYLKLRGSMGPAGNSAAINSGIRFDVIAVGNFQGNPSVLPVSGTIGNPDIKWEQTFNWDAGLEIRFFNERISLAADIYNKKTKDLIYNTNLPSVSGATRVLANIGNIKNNGIEVSLSGAPVKTKNFSWNLTADWSSNQNKLTKANVNLATVSGNLLANEVGRNFNSFYMPVWAGVNPADGRPQWLDASGRPTSTYSAAKKEFVGKPQPDGFGSINNTFRYKNFQLTTRFYYQYGAVLYNDTYSSTFLTDGVLPYINQVEEAVNYWRKPGDISANPRRMLNNLDGSNSISTRYLYKADYVRLQNLNLGYTFPNALVNRLHLSSLRIFAQGDNLALFTLYPGRDPDNASVGGNTAFAYPSQTSFSMGLNISF